MNKIECWDQVPVLLTGGFGFVGANLVQRLQSLGAKVVCLVKRGNNKALFNLLNINQEVKIIELKRPSVKTLTKLLTENNIKVVFHLAAKAIVNEANKSPLEAFETNIRGTYTLLEACRQNKNIESIVVASSDRTYGKQTISPFHEDLPLLGLLPYDASKVCTDVIARSFAYSYDMPIGVTRFSNIYGGGDLNFSRIIPGTIKSVLENEAPIIRSDGKSIREFVYIDDAVSGYLKMAENIEAVRGGAINFGSGEPISVLELVQKVIKICGKQIEPIVLGNQTTFRIDAQYSSFEKAEKLLHWSPKTNLDKGLEQTISWYQNHPVLINQEKTV